MTATSTSIDTYHDVGFMQTARLLREKIAIHVLRCGSLTNKEIATDLRLETSTVSGRVNELKKSRLLVEVDGRACSVTGRNVKCVAHVLNVPAHGDKT